MGVYDGFRFEENATFLFQTLLPWEEDLSFEKVSVYNNFSGAIVEISMKTKLYIDDGLEQHQCVLIRWKLLPSDFRCGNNLQVLYFLFTSTAYFFTFPVLSGTFYQRYLC